MPEIQAFLGILMIQVDRLFKQNDGMFLEFIYRDLAKQVVYCAYEGLRLTNGNLDADFMNFFLGVLYL